MDAVETDGWCTYSMKQILQNLRSGETTVTEVPPPQAGRGKVLIRTTRSLISAGTERMLVEFGQAGLLGKAKAQPEKVKQVLDKMRTEGLMPTLDAVFNRLDEPLPLGYCNAGVVIEAEVGDQRTEVGGQAAEDEGENRPLIDTDSTLIEDSQKNRQDACATFGPGIRVVSNGPHAEFVCVPENLCARIPDGVSDEEASFTVLASVGLQGVRLAQPTLGETFVVYGLGLIGLVTLQLLRANGCRVIGVDLNPERLRLAEQFGATVVHPGAGGDPVAAAMAATGHRGVDGVLITASAKTDEIVHLSAEMCRKRGRIVLVGVTGLNLRRADFYEKELTFQVSCSYGPGRYDEAYEENGIDYPYGFVRWTEKRNFEAVLELMASGQLDVTPLISRRFALEDAPEAYEVVKSDKSALGVVLEYPVDTGSWNGPSGAVRPRTDIPAEARRPQGADGAVRPRTDGPAEARRSQGADGAVRPRTDIPAEARRPQGPPAFAMIGAGNFAKMTMAPALAKSGARLKYVSDLSNGPAAQHVAKKYGFEFATSDTDAVLADEEVDAVLVATGHSSHAALVCKGLAAGKHVFVEKPLAMNDEQLEQVIAAYQGKDGEPLIGTNGTLMVGFNRRFSPHVAKVKELLGGRSEPLAVVFTANAGIIPPDVWVHDPEKGGGRIIGEACHYMDLLSFVAGSPIVAVSAMQMGDGPAVREDKMSIVLSFADGSVGTVNYFGNGHKGYPKERMEVYSEGRILHLDNFRLLRGWGFKGFRKLKTKMDKGHQAEFKAYAKQIASGGEPLIPFEQLVNVTRASFAAVQSANENQVIRIPWGNH